MSITVIDQGPELFWFVSNALVQEEISLKHIQSVPVGETTILHELPKIVIINGDDKTLHPVDFINRMRNHVFARNTLFIVVTSDISIEFKKALLVAGAGQILYRGKGFSPSPKFFVALIKWFLNNKEPDPQTFDYKPVAFPAEAEFTAYGRIGWINATHCMIECNINLNPGQMIEIKNSLFDELAMKDVKLECIEKNKVGRYYQYANSILCKIHSKNIAKDSRKLANWIINNHEISKHKPIKVVYFESDATYRDEIKRMIKSDRRYCARGYGTMEDFEEILNYQLPHLILINREMIQKEKAKFELLRNFIKTHFCYCVTYSESEVFSVEEFRKNYEFAMHAPTHINLPLLESMIAKLEEKLPEADKTDDKKIYFNKHSNYSRMSLHSHAKLTELALNGAGIILPFTISNFCACEVTSNAFAAGEMNRGQFFRSFTNKQTANGFYHRLVFMGQNVKDNEQVRAAITTIEQLGFERWFKGETEAEVKK
jgi:hypothetical protein